VPSIIAAAIGTYYKYKGGYSGANESSMRQLVWLAKNNRPQPPSAFVDHPLHPGTAKWLNTTDEAYLYLAEVFARWPHLGTALVTPKGPIALVPLPASETTRATMGGRWPSLRLAESLAKLGFGAVRPCLVNRVATKAQTSSGSRIVAHEVAANTEVIERPRDGETVVYVDDVATYGHRIAGSDAALAPAGAKAVLCIAFTGASDGIDCYAHTLKRITYEPGPAPWDVTIEPV
jgi:hypothetical protein